MEKLIEAIYGGLLNGAVLGLMAIGLTLIWGALRMLNLAHGALYLVGGYVAWALMNWYDLPIWPSFILAVVAAGVVGLIIQLTLLNAILG
jgi:branched-chain amino acid transport system permease protein